jgi:hypothetical protein
MIIRAKVPREFYHARLICGHLKPAEQLFIAVVIAIHTHRHRSSFTLVGITADANAVRPCRMCLHRSNLCGWITFIEIHDRIRQLAQDVPVFFLRIAWICLRSLGCIQVLPHFFFVLQQPATFHLFGLRAEVDGRTQCDIGCLEVFLHLQRR